MAQSHKRAATDAFALLTGGVHAKFDSSKLHPAALAALTGTTPAKPPPPPHPPAHAAPPTANGAGGTSKRARKAAARAAAAAAAAAGGGGSSSDDEDERGGGARVFGGGGSSTNPQKTKRARTDELSAPLALPSAPRTNDPFEAANAARKALRIRVAGGDAPPLLESFAALAAAPGPSSSAAGGSGSTSGGGVPRRVLENVAAAGWDAPTPVQRQVIPALMRGREVFGIAPTGSGKTLAFALPIVATLAAARREWARRLKEEEQGQEAGGGGFGGGGGGKKTPPTTETQKKKKKKEKTEAADQERERAPPYDPHNGPHALVLAPTAELAAQIGRVFDRLTPGTGLRTRVLTAATAAGLDPGRVDVLVATPLRLVGLLDKGEAVAAGDGGGGIGGGGGAEGNGGGSSSSGKSGKKDAAAATMPPPSAPTSSKALVDLTRGLRFLVLDEADKLLSEEGGFVAQADAVLAAAGSRPWLARALLSATLPERVEHLARAALRDPLRVTVGERGAATASVDQRLLFVGREEGKMPALRQLLLGGAAAVLGGAGATGGGGSATGGGNGAASSPSSSSSALPPPLIVPPVLIFVSTKERARQLHRDLMHEGGGRLRVDSISADQPNAARRAAVENFRLGRTWVLIATDLIGRGMDFVGVNTVISYDFPRTGPDYVHRVGRTGRAGRRGCAVTFFTEDDAPRLRAVAAIIKAAGGHVPAWMTQQLKAPAHRRGGQQDDDKRPRRRQQAAGGKGGGGKGGGGGGKGGGPIKGGVEKKRKKMAGGREDGERRRGSGGEVKAKKVKKAGEGRGG